MQLIEGASVIQTSDSREVCFVVVGGVHGNEPAGIRAIHMLTTLVHDGTWQIEGNVYALIGNPEAINKSERFCEENLNRAFKDPESNTREGMRARDIRTWFSELAGMYKNVYLLDLHSVSIGETRIVVFDPGRQRSEAWAQQISPIPFRMGSPRSIVSGMLTSAIEKLGGVAVLIECGNHASETGVTVALEHIENALSSLHMLKAQKASFKGSVAYEGDPHTYIVTDIIKTAPGFTFTDSDVRSETFVKKGDVYAKDDRSEHRAVEDCYLMMPAKNPQPEDFDAGFLATRKA